MAELKIGRTVLGSCATNCYFLYESGKEDVLVIDPADRGEFLYEKLTEQGFKVAAILLTHGHFDHILGAEKLRALSGAKIYALSEEFALCKDSVNNLSGWSGAPYALTPDEALHNGQKLTIAGIPFQVLATPGHTSGSCCFYFEEAGFLVCGDTIFEESVGRTDFPTGSSSTLIQSVNEKIFTLPDSVKLYPGHGGSTTIEHEKKYNPFF